MKPARQGSFLFELIVLIEANPATSSVAAALSAAPFYDFLKTAFRRATGQIEAEPNDRHLSHLYNRKEPPVGRRLPADLDELGEMLEGSLKDAHRPIGAEGTIETLRVETPRKVLNVFNSETKDWVNTRETAVAPEILSGNITRYNALSRNGRAYIDQLEKVVPVRPDGDFVAGDLQYLTWSLHGSNVGLPNKLEIRARRVTSASGITKRLLLSSCSRMTE